MVQTPAGEPDGPAPVRTRARGQIIPPPIKVRPTDSRHRQGSDHITSQAPIKVRQTVVIDRGQIIPPPIQVRQTVVIDRGQIIPLPIKVRQTVVIDSGQIIPPSIKVT